MKHPGRNQKDLHDFPSHREIGNGDLARVSRGTGTVRQTLSYGLVLIEVAREAKTSKTEQQTESRRDHQQTQIGFSFVKAGYTLHAVFEPLLDRPLHGMNGIVRLRSKLKDVDKSRYIAVL